MIKVALVITMVSINNSDKPPDISIPVYYENLEECNKQLEFLKETVNATDILDSNNNRVLKMLNREYHNQSFIYWTCSITKKKQNE